MKFLSLLFLKTSTHLVTRLELVGDGVGDVQVRLLNVGERGRGVVGEAANLFSGGHEVEGIAREVRFHTPERRGGSALCVKCFLTLY